MNSFSPIHYFNEGVTFELIEPALTASWIQEVVHQEGYQLVCLNFIFCSDKALHAKNLHYLQHDTWTDILTFDYSAIPQQIESDVYISIERVQENASLYAQDFWQELYTVMVHGVLHLLGYGDHEEREIATMREKEAYYVKQRLAKKLC